MLFESIMKTGITFLEFNYGRISNQTEKDRPQAL